MGIFKVLPPGGGEVTAGVQRERKQEGVGQDDSPTLRLQVKQSKFVMKIGFFCAFTSYILFSGKKNMFSILIFA